jgi:hypothetical protein
MHRFRDPLNEQDLAHLRRILGEQEDPTFSQTKRRSRVNRITMDDTYLADQAVEPFRALSQDDRERLISDVVWRVTCYVEGSITKSPSGGIKLECGFRLRKIAQDGREAFCVVKPG